MRLRDKLLPPFFNFPTLAGYLLAVTSAGMIIVLFAVEFIAEFENPYLGILIYLVFPAFLVAGLVLATFGIWLARRRKRLELPEKPYPLIDLNDDHQRSFFVLFVVSSVIFVVVMSLATVKGYEYTESPSFCGRLCHRVMEPEYTAWKRSAHARVKCVECHIGPGATWFVKSKLSGLRQVVAVARETYSRPIPTPIEELRPSRDTCEMCHWPQKLYFIKHKALYHFAPNRENTFRELQLLLKIGGAARSDIGSQIHRHIAMRIEYIPRDQRRQQIPYVAVYRKDGVVEYADTASPPTKEELARGKRRMDCIDCHNRPTHIYRSPSREIDQAIMDGRIDPGLPFIKKIGMEILAKPYTSSREAAVAIASGVEFYYKNYPEVERRQGEALNRSIAALKEIYRLNIFPYMKVDWRAYPDNIGHLYSPGCFRCHDGRHRSKDGRVISKECTLCHTVLSQKQENVSGESFLGPYVHPADIGEALYTTSCSECHGGGS